MSGDAALYKPAVIGLKKNSIASNKLNDSMFSATLSGLIGNTSAKPATSSKKRSNLQVGGTKENIFIGHNKGTKKRALADAVDTGDTPSVQKHSTKSHNVDPSILDRSRRKMEEKARLYASMKRGDYVPTNGRVDKEAEGLVDFDRKWAEQGMEGDTQADSGSDDYDDETGRHDLHSSEQVEYEDELGRTRTGTKAEVAKILRQRNAANYAAEQLSSLSARPARPEGLISGDTIQSAAFNPDAPIANQMEELARRRDRSLTPPDDVHYDASKEIRSKGVGFYKFSQDKETRQQEMDGLEKEREITEAFAKERQERMEAKTKEFEERKRKIQELKAARKADHFLHTLDLG